MSEITFQQPQLGWVFIAAVALLLGRRLVRRAPFVAVSTHRILARIPARASPLRHLPMLVATSALGAMVLALMDPVWPRAEEQIRSRGVDLVIVLDLSSSMEEMMGTTTGVPLRVNRLEVTKRAISNFIARRMPGDRLGLIVFSDNAYVIAPLTFDHDYLQRYVASVDLAMLRGEGLTAIGEGLAAANRLLDRQSNRSRGRALVLFTDGENTFGRDPLGPLREARGAGIRVHMVGLDLATDVRQKPEVVGFIRAVRQGGGGYFSADTPGQLEAASRAIDQLEPGDLLTTRVLRHVPAYELFAAAAVTLLCCALALRCVPGLVDLT